MYMMNRTCNLQGEIMYFSATHQAIIKISADRHIIHIWLQSSVFLSPTQGGRMGQDVLPLPHEPSLMVRMQTEAIIPTIHTAVPSKLHTLHQRESDVCDSYHIISRIPGTLLLCLCVKVVYYSRVSPMASKLITFTVLTIL